ncbi:MAG: hypothetical protein JW852_11155 [Spirochaetales bacterium]|nr:hypothetical protein [Spirochaetales bacterium]
MKSKIGIIVLLLIGFAGMNLSAQTGLNNPDNPYTLELSYELGAVKVLKNTLQIGEDSTNFNFVTQGGEEILFAFQRYSGNLSLGDRHNIVLLYQPLEIVSTVTFRDAVKIDTTTFPAGDILRIKYGFPFWRLSYVYDFVDNGKLELGAGLSFQLRNASIVFESLSSGKLTTSQNLGPVPILKARGSYRFDNGFFAGAEIDGFYASSAFFNGADFDFEGSILDASVRAGLALRDDVDAFLNIRFLGGSAEGTSQYEDKYWTDSLSDYTSNYLSSLSLTLGLTIR